jgi:WD40 repeat protein
LNAPVQNLFSLPHGSSGYDLDFTSPLLVIISASFPSQPPDLALFLNSLISPTSRKYHGKFSASIFSFSSHYLVLNPDASYLYVTYSSDGQRLATSDTKGEIQIWDTCTGEQLIRCRGHQHWTWAVAFSPDGRYLASASDDYLVKLWDVETGQCLETYKGHTYSVNTALTQPVKRCKN